MEPSSSFEALVRRGSKVRDDEAFFRFDVLASWLRLCRVFQCSRMAWLRASDWIFPVTNVNWDVPDPLPVPLEELEVREVIARF